VRERLDVPTQVSVLAHVTTQLPCARERGAPLDVLFQSVGGTGGREPRLRHRPRAPRRGRRRDPRAVARLDGGGAHWYFETGQGSELSSARTRGSIR
jgi:ethanolamine ammonia-lyase large subunit